jgi:hypothetical protein
MKKKIKLFGLILITLAIFAFKQREQIVMETYESAITVYINTDVENISIDCGNGAIYDCNDGQFKTLNDETEWLEFLMNMKMKHCIPLL